MAISADTFLDRMRLKAQISRWRAAALIAVTLMLVVLLGRLAGFEGGAGAPPIVGDYIARIAIEDIILEDKERDDRLKKLAKDKAAQAVIVYINSPGGTIVGGETLHKRLLEMRKQKPVVAVLGSVAASGGYMVAAATDRIFTHEGTITGSIGVMLQTAEITDLAQKAGVNLLSFKSSPLKGVPSPFEKTTPEVRKVIDATIEDSYRLFVEMVAAHRPLTEKEVLALADGRVYTGRQAVENKLADAIGDETVAVTWMEKEKGIKPGLAVKDYTLKPEETPLEKWLTSFSGENIMPWSKLFSGKGAILALWSPGTF